MPFKNFSNVFCLKRKLFIFLYFLLIRSESRQPFATSNLQLSCFRTDIEIYVVPTCILFVFTVFLSLELLQWACCWPLSCEWLACGPWGMFYNFAFVLFSWCFLCYCFTSGWYNCVQTQSTERKHICWDWKETWILGFVIDWIYLKVSFNYKQFLPTSIVVMNVCCFAW